MTKFFFFAVVLTAIFISCNNTIDKNLTEIIVDLDNNNNIPTINIENIIPLNSDSLVGVVNFFDIYKERFYLIDNTYAKKVFVFDEKGNIINTTIQGKGPGELSEPLDFYIDKNNDEVLVWNTGNRTINYFSLDLVFKKKKRTDIILKNFTALNNNKWLVYSQSTDFFKKSNYQNNTYYNYFIYNKNFDTIDTMLIPLKSEWQSMVIDNPISKSEKNLFVCPRKPYIYSIDKDLSINKEYFVNFENKQITDEILEMPIEKIFAMQGRGEIVLSMLELTSNDNYISFMYPAVLNNLNYVIYSKKNKKVYLSEIIKKNKILPSGYIRKIKDNKFYLICNAPDYIDFVKSTNNSNFNVEGIDENNNPIIVIFTLL